jgi:hypothetical protein
MFAPLCYHSCKKLSRLREKYTCVAQRKDTPAGCSKRGPSHPPNPGAPRRALSQARPKASEEPRRYKPHFVWAVRPCNGSWRTEKPPTLLPTSDELLFNVEDLNDARTLLADFFSILLRALQPDRSPAETRAQRLSVRSALCSHRSIRQMTRFAPGRESAWLRSLALHSPGVCA